MAEEAEALENRRIDQLPPSAGWTEGSYLPMWNGALSRTEKIAPDQVGGPSTDTQNFEWISDEDYQEDDVVTWDGLWYQALVENMGITPGMNDAVWLPIPKSPSGFVMWQAGAYVEDEVLVMKELDGYIQMFRLAESGRPYVSANFELEFTQSVWELMSERSYMGTQKTAHGFIVNDVITFKSGNWNKYADGDVPLGIIRSIVSVDAFILLFFGARVKNMTGLTPATLYYIQGDGTIGTTETDLPALFAISSIEAILLSLGFGGGTVSPGPGPSDGFDYELDYELPV